MIPLWFLAVGTIVAGAILMSAAGVSFGALPAWFWIALVGLAVGAFAFVKLSEVLFESVWRVGRRLFGRKP